MSYQEQIDMLSLAKIESSFIIFLNEKDDSMNIKTDPFLSLAKAMIKQAKNDLKSKDERLALHAAKYFFLKPARGDNDDLMTFEGLCSAIDIHAETATKAIFNELLPHQQKRIRTLLQDAGYYVRSMKPSPVR